MKYLQFKKDLKERELETFRPGAMSELYPQATEEEKDKEMYFRTLRFAIIKYVEEKLPAIVTYNPIITKAFKDALDAAVNLYPNQYAYFDGYTIDYEKIKQMIFFQNFVLFVKDYLACQVRVSLNKEKDFINFSFVNPILANVFIALLGGDQLSFDEKQKGTKNNSNKRCLIPGTSNVVSVPGRYQRNLLSNSFAYAVFKDQPFLKAFCSLVKLPHHVVIDDKSIRFFDSYLNSENPLSIEIVDSRLKCQWKSMIMLSLLSQEIPFPNINLVMEYYGHRCGEYKESQKKLAFIALWKEAASENELSESQISNKVADSIGANDRIRCALREMSLDQMFDYYKDNDNKDQIQQESCTFSM